MELSGPWEETLRAKQEDQRTRKHSLAEESRPGVTGRRNVIIPSSLLNFESVDAKAKLGHIAHDVLGQVRVQIFKLSVRGLRTVGILGWDSTPVMVSWMMSRKLSPVDKMSRLEVHHKLA
eukprot:1152582-Pelagomonas_calceolata.AAC.5